VNEGREKKIERVANNTPLGHFWKKNIKILKILLAQG